jgi:hypothetical protein
MWEMDDHRLSMTDLSLEGILHCKQFNIIEKLASWEGVQKISALIVGIYDFRTPKPDISSFKGF